jgi:hypothetical protein
VALTACAKPRALPSMTSWTRTTVVESSKQTNVVASADVEIDAHAGVSALACTAHPKELLLSLTSSLGQIVLI